MALSDFTCNTGGITKTMSTFLSFIEIEINSNFGMMPACGTTTSLVSAKASAAFKYGEIQVYRGQWYRNGSLRRYLNQSGTYCGCGGRGWSL